MRRFIWEYRKVIEQMNTKGIVRGFQWPIMPKSGLRLKNRNDIF